MAAVTSPHSPRTLPERQVSVDLGIDCLSLRASNRETSSNISTEAKEMTTSEACPAPSAVAAHPSALGLERRDSFLRAAQNESSGSQGTDAVVLTSSEAPPARSTSPARSSAQSLFGERHDHSGSIHTDRVEVRGSDASPSGSRSPVRSSVDSFWGATTHHRSSSISTEAVEHADLEHDRTKPSMRLSTIDFERVDSYLRANARRVARRANSSDFTSSISGEVQVPSASRIVQHPYFEVVLAAAILSNAVFIGYQIDAVSSPEQQLGALIVNTAYALVFLTELLLRIAALSLRGLFCTGEVSVLWAYLDLATVLASMVEVAMDTVVYLAYTSKGAGEEDHGSVASNFRILRVMRCTRVIRCIRLTWLIRFVRSLRMLVHQIASCSKSLIWAVFLLAMIIYFFALMYTQAVHAHFGTRRLAEEALLELDPLGVYWSTVPRSMFTLFQAITGGVSWASVVLPLSDVDGIWVAMFVVYICFTQMAVLNVLIGAFCQNAIDSARHDQDLVAQSVLAERAMFRKQLVNIFTDIDRDASGEINIEEFRKHLENDSVQAVFDSFGIDASDAWAVFKLLDADHDGTVSVDDFLCGFGRLKGNARALDMAQLHFEHRSITKRMSRFMKRTDHALEHVCRKLSIEAPVSR